MHESAVQPTTSSGPHASSQRAIILKGHHKKLSAEKRRIVTQFLATVLEIPVEQVEILRVKFGSIILDVKLPLDAANRLLRMSEANDPILLKMGVERVRLLAEPKASAKPAAKPERGPDLESVGIRLNQEVSPYTVGARMSAHPVTIEPETSALSALGIMQYHHLRHLPVVDPSGRIVGILAERDLLLAASRHLHAGMEVTEVMARDVVTVKLETPLTEAAILMARHRFGSLPVVDAENYIVGIITEGDILRAFVDLVTQQREVDV